MFVTLGTEAGVAGDAHDGLGTRLDRGLLEDGLEMGLHCVLADPERTRDIAIAQTLREKERDLALAQRQAEVVAGPRLAHRSSEARAHELLLARDLL